MAICIKCGNSGSACLCDSCKQTVDIEVLCNDIINYKPGMGENQLWDTVAAEMTYPSYFKNLVFSVSADLPTPRKEYMRLLSIAAGSANVPKASRPWLYEIYEVFKANEGLTLDEKNRVRGLILGALYMDYRYEEADALAGKLLEQSSLPKQTFYLWVFSFNFRPIEIPIRENTDIIIEHRPAHDLFKENCPNCI